MSVKVATQMEHGTNRHYHQYVFTMTLVNHQVDKHRNSHDSRSILKTVPLQACIVLVSLFAYRIVCE